MSYFNIICLVFLATVCAARSESTRVRLSCSDIKELVDSHNQVRKRVARGKLKGQPKASNMQILRWDEELATKASHYATLLSRNRFDHNPDKTVPSGRFITGENLAWLASSDAHYKPNMTQAVEGWFLEHKYYTYTDKIDKNTFSEIGHYTQMVWAETNLIGCGVSKDVDGMTTYFYVCNYGPPGNFIGQHPYEKGAGCDNLCGDTTRLYGDNC